MPLTKLKAIDQGTWLKTGGGPERFGVCYYMCNYIENEKDVWGNPGTYANACIKAVGFGCGTTMLNYAKAQNLRDPHGDRQLVTPYVAVTGALAPNRIYRCGLWIGTTAVSPLSGQNHEIIIVTGANNDIVYFEPNFGFFIPSDVGYNNRQALEFYIAQQYSTLGYYCGNFVYYNVRSNASELPKGFVM